MFEEGRMRTKRILGALWMAALLGMLLAGPALAGWTSMGTGGTSNLEAVYGWTANDVLAVGAQPNGNERVLHYAGGSDFTQQNITPAFGVAIRGVWGSVRGNVWAVGAKGSGGAILHRVGTPGGPLYGWSLSSLASAPLNGVWGRGTNDVFAVGDGGLILHYNGTAWSVMTKPRDQFGQEVQAKLNDVFGDDHEVFAVGAGGVILRYDGTNWAVAHYNQSANDLYGVWVSSTEPVVGWAVGAAGTVLRLSGGVWTPQASGITDDLHDVWGLGATNAYAVGKGGAIYHHTTTWVAETSGTTNDLNGIWGVAAGPELFAVGNSRTILHYTPGSGTDPAAPVAVSPLDNATDVAMLPQFQWTCTDPVPGHTLGFTIYVDDRPFKVPGVLHASGETVSFTLPASVPLTPGSQHFWRILAKDSAGNEMTSDVLSFTTGSYAYITSLTPTTARPTYVIYISGVGFGASPGVVKIGTRVVDGLTFGKITAWSDTLVKVVLPNAGSWSGLPKTFPVQVEPAGSTTWSNSLKLLMTNGGGGTTW
jgi:hypothetical protein